MTVATNYSAPVTVNGFSCKNCTDVDYAKKHIDPAHPRSGPYGINAKDDPTAKPAPSSSVVFGGSLSDLNAKQTAPATQDALGAASESVPGATIGTQLDLSA